MIWWQPFVPLRPALEAEQMRECLRGLKQAHKVDIDHYRHCGVMSPSLSCVKFSTWSLWINEYELESSFGCHW